MEHRPAQAQVILKGLNIPMPNNKWNTDLLRRLAELMKAETQDVDDEDDLDNACSSDVDAGRRQVHLVSGARSFDRTDPSSNSLSATIVP
ncbi:hypothetical protein BVRB_021600 [Beta vulgaris subsp. vulgaris]|uniref:Uncharacterized protein n=1 Tax=Beta vulgaris subsp. vulgaris TaxID=3555 RepID=A0A0J8B084_BETVV|nr:hypothetical protein BVRB_021600 [Beta vulgaris subsp. vulgaris]